MLNLQTSEFLLNLTSNPLHKMVKAHFSILNLITYFFYFNPLLQEVSYLVNTKILTS